MVRTGSLWRVESSHESFESLLHSLTAVGMLLTPILVQRREGEDTRRLVRTLASIVGLFVLGSVAYLVLLSLFRVELVTLLYGGRYAEFSNRTILLVGMVPVGATFTVVLGSALRALERPHQIFWAYSASSLVALAAGLPLMRSGGIDGALWGLLLSYFAAAVTMVGFLWRDLSFNRSHEARAPAQ